MPFSGVPWRAVRCGCGRCCAVLCRAGTWKPSYVIDEDKKRANLVWHILLASIVGVFIWKAVSVIIKYHNPDTSFTVSDDVYPFPYMEVCFLESNGCDANISNCLQTEFHWVRDSCYTEVDVQIPSPEESWRCVTFDLGKLDYEKNECLLDTQRPFVEFEMFWIPTVDAAAEGEYNSRIAVYLGGSEVQQLTWLPYTRIELSGYDNQTEVTAVRTDMTIGKSTKKPLTGSSRTSYPTLALSSTELTSPNVTTFESEHAIEVTGAFTLGALFLTLTLGSFSLTTLKEDNPVDIPDFIASIGGFWEVLLLGWGIFFIATRDTTPQQKARRFEEPIERSIHMVRTNGLTRRSSRKSAAVSYAETGGEEQPNWDIAHGGPVQATGRANGGTAVSANSVEATGTNGGTVSESEATV